MAGLILAVLLALGVIYRSRLESWLLRHARDARRVENAVALPSPSLATNESVSDPHAPEHTPELEAATVRPAVGKVR